MPFDPGYDDHGLLGCVVICLVLALALVVLVVVGGTAMFVGGMS